MVRGRYGIRIKMEIGTILALACCAAYPVLPRSTATLAFLVGVLYVPMGAGFSLGEAAFPPARLLAAAGLLRVVMRHEIPRFTRLDWLVVAFGATMVLSGLFHDNPFQAIVFRCGYALDTLASYFVLRGLICTTDEVYRYFSVLILLLLPIAFEMVWEVLTRKNLFSLLGGFGVEPNIRKGRIRAQGPFRHAILAGTMAATLLPVAIALWQRNSLLGALGVGAVLVIVGACASSGPILTLAFALIGIVLWPHRDKLKMIHWAVIAMLLCLHFVMNDPIWFLIARMDIVGGSTGWHRARLIDSAIRHVDEWWFAGTDHTRHWMGGHGYNENSVDVTNHYIRYAVIGGLPLLLLLICLLKRSFGDIGVALAAVMDQDAKQAFFYWCVGTWLFANVVSMLSVSYYDQSLVLFYSTLGVIGSLAHAASLDCSSETAASLHEGSQAA